MKTRRFIVELTYDNDMMCGANPTKEELEWFEEDILKGGLVLFSGELGDDVGEIKIISEITVGNNIIVDSL